MADEEALAILRQGVEVWNQWRSENLEKNIDLIEANLLKANLNKANLTGANLTKANLIGANLIRANLSFADLRKADLRKANLTGANLYGTDINEANLTGANLYGTDLNEANFDGSELHSTDISFANLSRANLSESQFFWGYLIKSNLSEANLTGADLHGTDISFAKLTGANLYEAKLSKVNLTGANLTEANLSQLKALGANFAFANLTGACIEDWHINNETNFTGVICAYIYLRDGEKERRPSDPTVDFAPGEFVALVQKSLETVDLIFADGIDWKAFLSSFNELKTQYGEDKLAVQAIEQKKSGAFVIKLEVPQEANKGEIERQAKEYYENNLKLLETRYHKELQAKDEQIILYRQHNTSLEKIIDMLGNRPIQNIINVTAQSESKSMSESNQSNFSVGGNVDGNVNNVQGDNNRAVQGDNNQAVLGDNNQVTQQNQVGTGESLTKEDIVKLLAELETLVKGAKLPNDTKKEVIEDLSATKNATDKEEPNKKRALERLTTVAETLEKTSKSVEAGNKIWSTAKPIIVKVATWLGAVVSSHLLGL